MQTKAKKERQSTYLEKGEAQKWGQTWVKELR